ncbi:MAG: hypothetical protein RLZZ272_290 [Actinomycetota bacterium]
MTIDPDTARSDVALTAVALVLGTPLAGAVRGSSAGALGVVLWVLAVVAVTTLPALLLARSRGDGAAALGLEPRGERPAAALAGGLGLALPVALGAPLAWIAVGAAPDEAVWGRLALASGAVDAPEFALRVLGILALAVGTVVVVPFLALRARDASPRSPDRPLLGLLRTGGMGAAVIALAGGLASTALGTSGRVAVINALALAALVLAADRIVGPGTRVPRLAVIVPALVVGLAQAGGVVSLLRSGLPAIAPTALSVGTTVVLASVALSRRGTWPLLPVALALALWPSCLSPLPMASGVC